MMSRCFNPNVPSFKHYGGKGITVCERWRTFENFLADMGEKPDGLSIDRKEVTGNYEPGNCRWATPKEQARNKRNTVMVGSVPAIEISETFGANRHLIADRLAAGWSHESAVSVPLMTKSEAAILGNKKRWGHL